MTAARSGRASGIPLSRSGYAENIPPDAAEDSLNGKRGDIPKSQVEYAIKIYGTKTSEEK